MGHLQAVEPRELTQKEDNERLRESLYMVLILSDFCVKAGIAPDVLKQIAAIANKALGPQEVGS